MKKKQKPTSEHFKAIGAKGGKATVETHGRDYMAKISKKGGQATRRKYAGTGNK